VVVNQVFCILIQFDNEIEARSLPVMLEVEALRHCPGNLGISCHFIL